MRLVNSFKTIANRALACTLCTGLFFTTQILTPNITHAEEIDIRGNFAVNNRYFFDEGLLGQNKNTLSLSLSPEFAYEWNDGDDQFISALFYRKDQQDDERTHFDIREAYWLHVGDGWEVRAGIASVYWGVIESQHLVDVINQTDAVEGADGEDKLGQPMVHLTLDKEWGILEMFWMPYFRERNFPSTAGRFLGNLNVSDEGILYQSKDEESHNDYAIRWSQNYDEIDIAVSWFDGTSRAPQLIPSFSNQGLVFNQYYSLLAQLGLELQWTHDEWLWKLEAVSREEGAENYFAASVGLEYSFYGVFESDADLGFLVEYHFDDRGNKQSVAMDNDTFVGFRYVLNDTDSSEILTGVIIDNDHQGYAFSLEASTRVSNNLKLVTEIRLFENFPANDQFYVLDTENYLEIELLYYY